MKINALLKCVFDKTPGIVCDLVKTRRGFKEFSSVFPFSAWLLPKSQWFNQQQAKLASVGRLWSYAGLVVWFRAMWTIECRKEPFILMFIPFICVTLACPICFIFKGFFSRLRAGACCVSFCVCCTCCVKLQYSKGNRESILFWQQDWLGHYSSLPLCLSALRSFYLLHNQILSLTSTTDILTTEP